MSEFLQRLEILKRNPDLLLRPWECVTEDLARYFLGYEPNEHQQRILTTTRSGRVLDLPRRCGKTDALAARVLIEALAAPHRTLLVASPAPG